MSEWPSRWIVARWEIQRFLKLNQLVTSFVIMMAMGVLGYGVSAWARRSDSEVDTVAVIGGSALGIDRVHRVENLSFTPAVPSELDSLKAAVTARNLDGILVLEGADSARLIVRREPFWKGTLETHLSTARQRYELGKAGLTPERLSAMLAPVAVTTEFQSGNDGRAARVVAFIAAGLVLYGVFTSMAYLMVSVTAEKQQRVTEQVLSAISPQTWMDGKILGIAAVSLVNVLLSAASAALWVLGRAIALDRPFSLGSADPSTIAWIILFALLGFLFWISLFAAIAATIDDPNTSTRGPLMFLPAFFSVPAFLIVINPDSMFARITGIVPFTSSTVMAARVAVTDVPLWELVLSAALLIVGGVLARRAAGKVFSIAMLMYGKEPSWGEIRRWVRES